MTNKKTLILFRHSDANNQHPNGDFNRELTEGGKEKALNTAKWLSEKEIQIDKTICSDSTRTKQTFDIIKKVYPTELNPTFEHKIYENNFMDINRCIMKQKKDLNNILIIGHNPTLSHLAAHYAEIYRFPTSGCLILEFDTEEWNHIDPIFVKKYESNFTV